MDDLDHSKLDERIFRLLKGRATPEEVAALRRWQRISSENEERLARLEAMLEAVERAYASRERPAPPPIETLTGAGKAKVIALPVGPGRVHRESVRPRWRLTLAGGVLSAAAVVVLLLAVGVLPFGSGGGLALAEAEYITGSAETALVTLGDGSVVRLAPNSRLRVVPRADRREVHLEGRAYFAVAEDERVPFVVETASGRTRVLGTRFDVEARAAETRVIVVEGRVELATSAGEVELAANELSLVRRDEVPRKAEVADAKQLLGWLETFIAFQETPLEEVGRELEGRFGIEVRITDPELAKETVTGWSNGGSAEEVLTRVCLAVNARCTLSDTLIVMEPNPVR